jgi:hypothetical protein
VGSAVDRPWLTDLHLQQGDQITVNMHAIYSRMLDDGESVEIGIGWRQLGRPDDLYMLPRMALKLEDVADIRIRRRVDDASADTPGTIRSVKRILGDNTEVTRVMAIKRDDGDWALIDENGGLKVMDAEYMQRVAEHGEAPQVGHVRDIR